MWTARNYRAGRGLKIIRVSADGWRHPQEERTRDGRMIKVKARGNESVEQRLRRFKTMCEKEGLTKDIKRNSYYEKPSERRRRRQRKSMKRQLQDKK